MRPSRTRTVSALVAASATCSVSYVTLDNNSPDDAKSYVLVGVCTNLSNISFLIFLTTFLPTQAIPYVEIKPAILLSKNSPTKTIGKYLMVSGSLSTKLPSSRGFISAAKAVSVTAKAAIARIAKKKTNLCSKV